MTDILTGIFSRILNTSVAACFLIGAVFLLRFVFRKVAPKTIICFLWGIVALRLVLPFSIQSPIGLVPEKASTVASVFETATEAKPAEMVTPVETLTPIDPVSPAEPTANDPQQTVPVTQPDLQTVDPVTPYPQSPVTASVEADSQSGRSGTIETVSESSIGIGFILSLIWIAGLAGMLTYVLIHYLLLRKKMADSVPYLQGIRQSEKVRSPFVLGLFRPLIYLPFGLDKQTESHVLAHERAHISRGDHWFKFLWFAVLAVHWFNPLAWLAFILLCGDIEYACDERVLSTMEEPDKKAYAESLLGLGISSRRVSACPVAFGETNVKNRIRRVFDFKKPAAWILALILFSCILLTACFSTVSVSPIPGEESRSEPVSDSEPSDDPGSAVDAPSDSSPGELSQIPADPSENGRPAMTREYRMVSYTDLNTDVTATYSYDKYGQLVKTVRSDGSETVYTYTDDGHPLTEVHTSGGQTAMSVTWLYDPDGRLTEKKDSFGSSIRYEYDENGRLAKQIQSVSEQTYAYDENGNYAVTTVLGDGKTHVAHFNIAGKPVRTTVDGRVTNEYDYDEFGDLNESRSYDDSGKVFEYIRYHYAVDGSLIKKEISTEPGEVHYLRYDGTLVGESLDYEYRITYVSKDGKEKPFGACRLSPMKIQKDGSRFDNRAFLPPEQKRLVGAFETGAGGRSLEELKKEFPQYFGLDPTDGLTVYVFAVAPETYWCAALAETGSTDVQFKDLNSGYPVSVEEMKRILASYSVPDSSVKIVPGYAAVSSYIIYLADVADRLSALFDNRYEVVLPAEMTK